eukprot:g71.t1
MNHFNRVLKTVLNRGLCTRSIVWDANKLGGIADGKCTVHVGSTAILATVVCRRKPSRSLQPTPLQVQFRDRGFRFGVQIRDRDARLSQLVERAIRPLFPVGFVNETCIRATALSTDEMTDTGVLAINAVSGAFVNSDIAFRGPIGACKVAKFNDSYFVNPSQRKLETADFVLTYAGTDNSVVLLEGFGKETAAQDLCEMMDLAQNEVSQLIQEQMKFALNHSKRQITCSGADPTAAYRVMDLAKPIFQSIYANHSNLRERKTAIEDAKEQVEKELEELGAMRSIHSRIAGSGCVSSTDLLFAFSMLEDSIIRESIQNNGLRSDNRYSRDLRPSICEVDVFPALHGSAVFTSGETQAVSLVTVASTPTARHARYLAAFEEGHISVSYQLPPYATNEHSRFHKQKNWDASAGSFIETALSSIKPATDEFPFGVLVDVETTASDGSSLMASVSFGAISSVQRQYFEHELGTESTAAIPDFQDSVLLLDIQENEELYGDMNFNICGTELGITGIQLADVIPGGVHMDTLKSALNQAMAPLKRQIVTIRDSCSESINKSRVSFVNISQEYIGTLLGQEGTNIRQLESEFGTAIVQMKSKDKVAIYSDSLDKFKKAEEKILSIQGANIKEGEVYRVKVVKIADYGAFVLLPTGFQALLHISEIAEQRISSVADVLKEGESVMVKCLGRDSRGDLRLSMKALELDSMHFEDTN